MNLFDNPIPPTTDPPFKRRRAPLARAADPVTSHEAAAEVECSGLVAKHEAVIAAGVCQRPGSTAVELAEVTGLDRVAIGRRLREMARKGLVAEGPARACSVNLRSMLTWWPAAKANENIPE